VVGYLLKPSFTPFLLGGRQTSVVGTTIRDIGGDTTAVVTTQRFFLPPSIINYIVKLAKQNYIMQSSVYTVISHMVLIITQTYQIIVMNHILIENYSYILKVLNTE